MKRPPPSFTRALVLNATGLLAVLGAAFLVAMIWQAIDSTRETEEREVSHSLERAVERLNILIRAAEMTVDSAARAAGTPAVTGSTLRSVMEISLAAFEQRPELSYLGLVLAQHGEYGNLERTADGRILLWLHPGSRPTDRVTRNFLLTDTGFVPHEERDPNGYDPRVRPFYRAVQDTRTEGRWLPCYRWIVHGGSATPLWGFSYVRALRDPGGDLLGVLDADLDLPALNRFLAYIAAEYRVDLRLVELGETPRLVGAPEVGSEPQPVPEALSALIARTADGAIGHTTWPEARRWTAVRHLTLPGGPTWVVIASREAPLIGAPLRKQLYQVAGMGLAMLLGLLVISVYMARRLGRPLAELERSVAAIEQLDNRAPLLIAPVADEFRETQRLGAALGRMTTALRQREAQLAVQNVQLLEAKEQQLASLALKGAVFDSTDTVIFSLGEGRRVVEWNTAAERMFGLPREDASGRPIAELVRAPDGPADWSSILATTDVSLFRLVGRQGEFDAELRVIPLQQNGSPVHTLFITDVSARRKAERRLRQERDYADAVLNSLPGVFYHCDEDGHLQRWNRNLERITGASAEQLEGMDPRLLMPEEERAGITAKIAEVLSSGQAHFEASYVLPDGRRVPCLFTGVRFEHDDSRGFVGIGTDISERKRAERRLQYLATHDVLTGLPNRHLLQERLVQAMTHAGGNGRPFALLLVDLDRFKVINDAYGHAFGDEVLKTIGARLVALLSDSDTVARHGGDQFLILLAELRSPANADAIAGSIIESLRQPVTLQGREIHLSGSIGLSLFPQDGDTTEALITHADLAMYRAKMLGRNTFQGFTREMGLETQQRVNLETSLRGAAAAGQLQLVYQPKVSLANGAIVGCEALLRWHHPELGMVPPNEFIPIAEDSGLIVPISDWVLRTACTQAKAWADAGLPPTPVAVNISARQLLQQDLAAWTLDMLQETGLAAELLELELTESLIAQDVKKMIATFERLKATGVKLSIDDFGTGYSSLAYLKHFRVDTLKIDQSFVRNMLTQTEDATIVRTVIALAHNLKFKVIAEGVETAEHCRVLREHHCDEVQGYYFSKPVSADVFEALLRRGLDVELATPL